MKLKILFLFCILGVWSCTDRYYDGSQRYVVQGTFLKDGEPLQHELVVIDAYGINEETNVRQDFSTINWYSPSNFNTVVNTTYTDKHGAFKISFPGGNYDYVINLENYRKFIVSGKYSNATHLIDLGRIDIAKKE